MSNLITRDEITALLSSADITLTADAFALAAASLREVRDSVEEAYEDDILPEDGEDERRRLRALQLAIDIITKIGERIAHPADATAPSPAKVLIVAGKGRITPQIATTPITVVVVDEDGTEQHDHSDRVTLAEPVDDATFEAHVTTAARTTEEMMEAALNAEPTQLHCEECVNRTGMQIRADSRVHALAHQPGSVPIQRCDSGNWLTSDEIAAEEALRIIRAQYPHLTFELGVIEDYQYVVRQVA